MTTNILAYTWLIPVFPIIAFVALLLGGRKLTKVAPYIGITAIAASFTYALLVMILAIAGRTLDISAVWFSIGRETVKVGLLIDPLAAMMLIVVTSVSLLVQIYSIGYMHGEPRLHWYFAAISLFSAAMLSLVIANNFLQVYISWELVGLCSYFLIGFWYEKKSASNAAMKAFIMTRIGDVGFFLGLVLIYVHTGSFGFEAIRESIAAGTIGAGTLTAIALLVFCGAAGKSAQFPLYGWLPDAMEGPTPVSALIHAATMVAAGVYLVARSFFIFEAAHPIAMSTVAILGAFTAFLAAMIAVTMSDIKKVLAYSTISQLGFMMAALGVGGYAAGVFHLVTHAFFKALLFLGAGSVIHGAATQNIYEMGGLMKKMKITAVTFFIATLSIAGIVPLSGFWSKDEILSAAAANGNYLVLVVLLVTAFLTSFYMFRLYFTVFAGPLKDKHVHESPLNMTIPLSILAVPAALAGLLGAPLLGNLFGRFLEGAEYHAAEPNYMVMVIALGAAITGIGAAWSMYSAVMPEERFGKPFFLFYNLIKRRFFFDEIANIFIIKPVVWVAGVIARADVSVLDAGIHRAGSIGMRGAELLGRFDNAILDGTVNSIGALIVRSSRQAARVDKTVDSGYEGVTNMIRAIGETGRKLYSGSLSRYLGVIFAGFIVLAMFVYLLFAILK